MTHKVIHKPAPSPRRTATTPRPGGTAAEAHSVPAARVLQQRLGNEGTRAFAARVVARSAAPRATSTSTAGTRSLSISQPGDAHEREADRMADIVMRMPAPASTPSNGPRLTGASAGGVVQRLCAECEEESKEQKVQRQEGATDTPQVTAPVAASISALRGGGSPLPASARAFFEPRFGADFSQVRVHTDGRAADAAKSINAKAFTVGRDVAFGAGQYAPESHEGRRLLAHELTHVAQQNGSQLQRTAPWESGHARRIIPSEFRVQRAWYDVFAEGAEAVWGGAKWAGGKVAGGAEAVWEGAQWVGGKAKWLGGKAVGEARRVGGAALECAGIAGRSIIDLATLSLPSLHDLLGLPKPVQGSPIGMLDVIIGMLRHPCLRMLPGYTILAGAFKKIQAVYPFLKGAWEVLQNPDPVIDAIRESLSGMMNQIPAQARDVARKAITFSDPPERHLQGIWRHLEPKLAFLAGNWWEVLKQTAWDLLWPWPGVGKDLGEIWGRIKSGASDIWDLNLSGAVDHLLAVWRTANSAIGRLYGWFFLGSVLVGAIIGAFFGGAGAIPGAAAGAKFAMVVGQYLLISTIAAETVSIGKAGFDLVFADQTDEANEEDYEQISNSGIVLGITGALYAVGALAARFARGVINRVAGLAWQRPALRGRGATSRGDIIEIRVAAATGVTALLRRHTVTWLESLRRNFPVIDLLEGGRINVIPRPGRAPLYQVTGGRLISVKSTAQLAGDAQSAIRGWVDELANFTTKQNVSVTNPAGRTLIVAVQTPLDDTAAAAVRTYATGRGVRLEMFTNLPPNHPAVVFPDAIPTIMAEAGVVAADQAKQPQGGTPKEGFQGSR